MGQKGADEFVLRHFANEPRIVEAWQNMPNVGMKSDFLRYLLLSVEGGVYTDTDTVAIKPIDDWLPKELRGEVRLIVGIEFDRWDGPQWGDILHWLQFCQWTIAAAPGHPVFRKMIDYIVNSLGDLEFLYDLPLNQIEPTSTEVMMSTGPAAWTDVVFSHLKEIDPTLNSTRDLSPMEHARLFDDVLILTIDGFGMGQQHSHSTRNGTIPEAALIRHLFRGSWRPAGVAPDTPVQETSGHGLAT